MRRLALPLLLLSAVILSGADRPKRTYTDTPQRAFARLKRAVAKKDRAAEWALLSPGFKKRMNKRAGRVVDLADYEMARNANAKDPEIRQAERYLRSARMTVLRYTKGGQAQVSVRFGGPLFFGTSIRARMIHLELWRVEIHGETQPYWGFTGDRNLDAKYGPDGGVVIRSYDAKGKVTYEEKFAKKDVKKFTVFTKWFFDSFGKLEERFFQ